MTLPLAIWTTGSPVEEAEARRGNFFEMISEPVGRGFPGEFLDISCLESPSYPNPKSVSGIVVSGSPARLGTQEPWMKECEEALRAAHQAGVPILGICFGHQLLGEALGGVVAENPRGREIGTCPISSLATDPLLDGIVAPPIVVMSHLDSVIKAPLGAKVLASTELEAYAALRYSDTTWSVQFHPEMDAEVIGYYLSDRRNQIESEGIDVDELLGSRRESAYGAELLGRFGRFCATRAFDSPGP